MSHSSIVKILRIFVMKGPGIEGLLALVWDLRVGGLVAGWRGGELQDLSAQKVQISDPGAAFRSSDTSASSDGYKTVLFADTSSTPRLLVREKAFGSCSRASRLKTLQTILVIDDEADLANTCARLLKGAGFECEVACTMDDALAKFDAKRPSLVLSDITLQIGDGFEITRYVRAKSPDTPVILMTGYHSPVSQEEARRSGASHYLRKPFSNSQLLAIIRLLLDQ